MQWIKRHSLRAMLLFTILLAGCDTTSVDAPELTPPILLRPVDAQSVIVGNPVSFSWAAVDGAAQYQCEVRQSDEEGGTEVITEFTDETTAQLTFTGPGVYAWRVRGRNADDEAGLWSEMWEITVQAEGDNNADQ